MNKTSLAAAIVLCIAPGLHDTSEQDLRAMYRYIKHLRPAGQPAPPFVPPDKDPPTPYEVRTRVLK